MITSLVAQSEAFLKQYRVTVHVSSILKLCNLMKSLLHNHEIFNSIVALLENENTY